MLFSTNRIGKPSGCGLRVAGYALRVTGYELRVTGYALRGAGYLSIAHSVEK